MSSHSKEFPPIPQLTEMVKGHYENDEFVFFWTGPFSNWAKGKFSMVLENEHITFNCSEQAMMYIKAMLFGDYGVRGAVLETNDPKEQKRLGRTIKNFDQAIWEKFAREQFYTVLVEKFAQVPGYRQILVDTGNKILVEASPFDTVWGIGMGVNNPNILDISKWNGKNILGDCLMQARVILR